MKGIKVLLLVIGVAGFQSSCMSLDMIAHAEGKAPPTAPQGSPYASQPGYYALVPLVLPLDLLMLPIQYVYFQSNRTAAEERGNVQ